MRLFALALVILVAIGCSGPAASPEASTWNLSTSLDDLDLGGGPTGSFDVVTDGSWSAVTSASWLQVSPAEGVGPTNVTVTAHREGLTPDARVAEVMVTNGGYQANVLVGSRFPTIDVSAAWDEGTGVEAASATAGREPSLDDVDHHPTELIVTLEPLEPDAAASRTGDLLATIARDHGAEVVGTISTGTQAIATFTIIGDLGQAVHKLRQDPRVADVSPSVRIETLSIEPLSSEQAWHYQAINLQNAWTITSGASGVTVAVIDSGFDMLHDDLRANLAAGYDFGDRDAVAHAETAACGDHGTHVAGTVGAPLNGLGGTGVSPIVTIAPLKIGTYNASTGACELWSSALLDAIYHAAGADVSGVPPLENPVDVINLSLGGVHYNTALHAAVQFAAAEGVTLVAASGNGGDRRVLYPAAHPEVIAVGATNPWSERTAYSSYGSELDLMAPGGESRFSIASTRWSETSDVYGPMQGTSMATPHVAGVVALMKSVNLDLGPASVQHLLQASARDIGEQGWDEFTGFGIIDTEAAVRAARAHVSSDETTLRLHALNEDGSWRLVADSSDVSTLRHVQAGFTSYRAEAGIDADTDGILGEPGEWFGSEWFDLASDQGDRSVTVRMTRQ